jgi:peptidoglycan hydrolase-like protein with peptidoglycan-binding domain
MRRISTIAANSCAVVIAVTIVFGCINRGDAAGTGSVAQNVQIDPGLIREVQFMLLRLGLDPGPIDGNAGRQTNRAVRAFELQAGLPAADLPNEGSIAMEFLTRLRDQAARAMFANKRETELSPAPPATGSGKAGPAAGMPAPAPPAPDPFAACQYNANDFRIGESQYTPDKFLRLGFGGSTARAVASLKERLEEARQIAGNIGGAALAEVQRQARVLNYFECRLKIEEAATDKK